MAVSGEQRLLLVVAGVALDSSTGASAVSSCVSTSWAWSNFPVTQEKWFRTDRWGSADLARRARLGVPGGTLDSSGRVLAGG